MPAAKSINVDVVLAHFNGSKFIEAQLNSILESKLKEETRLRVLIVDDSSTAPEFEFLEKVCAPHPQVFIHRIEANVGVIRAFETGFNQSTAEYIMAADQDDIWLPDKIQSSLDLLRKIENGGAALVFTDLRVVNQQLEVLEPRMLNLHSFEQERDKNRFLFQNIVAGCTIAMNRRLLGTALPFPAGIPMHDYWLAACAAFGGRIALLNEPTVLYRQHAGNVVGSSGPRLLSRILSARSTLRQLHEKLLTAGTLDELLAERLEARKCQAEIATIRRASEAMKRRNLSNLLFLIKSRVLNLGPLRMALTSVAYLLISNYGSKRPH